MLNREGKILKCVLRNSEVSGLTVAENMFWRAVAGSWKVPYPLWIVLNARMTGLDFIS